jgi:hypothetical protein
LDLSFSSVDCAYQATCGGFMLWCGLWEDRAGEKCVVKCCVIGAVWCRSEARLNGWGWDGWSVAYVGWVNHFWLESPKGRYLWDRHRWEIILEWISRKWCEGVDWICVIQD